MALTLGIDQSYNNSGFCVVDEIGTVIEFGTYKTDKTLDVYDRAVQVATFIVDKMMQHQVTRIHIEGLAFGIRGDATRDLAGLLFTIITAIRRQDKTVAVHEIAPTSLKKFATKSGKAAKSEMMEAVPSDVMERFTAAKFKKTTGLADLCDAYWLARYNKDGYRAT